MVILRCFMTLGLSFVMYFVVGSESVTTSDSIDTDSTLTSDSNITTVDYLDSSLTSKLDISTIVNALDKSTPVEYLDNVTTPMPQGCTLPMLKRDHRPELLIIMYFQLYKGAIIFPIAFVGNILAFLGNYEKAPRSPPHFYMTFLSIMDLVSLAIREVDYQLSHYEVLLPPGTCQALEFFTYFFTAYAIWILVVMTVERVIVVMMPLKATQFLTVQKAVITMILVAIILTLLAIPQQITLIYGYDVTRGMFLCSEDLAHPVAMPARWLRSAIIGFIPDVVLVLSNFMIIVGITRASQRQAAMTGGQRKTSAQERQVTVTMVIISVTFVALTTPDMLVSMDYDIVNPYTSCLTYVMYGRFALTAYYLFDLNNSINGYLYCVSSANFRKELSKKLCGFRRRGTGRSISGTTRMTGISMVSTGSFKRGIAGQSTMDETSKPN